ncbi:MAG: hypothetical protein OEN56_14900, partial [Gemmatimonadota bacterium]|nr:hypothetical protein [Gemmatimonadota bacterium]
MALIETTNRARLPFTRVVDAIFDRPINLHLHRTTRVLLTRLSLAGSLAAGSLALSLAGCATLGQIGALQNVDFALQGVSNVRLAGIDLNRVRSFSDLGFGDGARLVAAVANRDL